MRNASLLSLTLLGEVDEATEQDDDDHHEEEKHRQHQRRLLTYSNR